MYGHFCLWVFSGHSFIFRYFPDTLLPLGIFRTLDYFSGNVYFPGTDPGLELELEPELDISKFPSLGRDLDPRKKFLENPGNDYFSGNV